MNKEGLFKEWLDTNANKDIVLCRQGIDVYHTDVTCHSNKQIKELKAYHTTGKKQRLLREEAQFTNGQPWYRRNYKNGTTPCGLSEAWHGNGQLKYHHNYKDGKEDGLWEDWYANGQREHRGIYKDGKLDSLWEGWCENGQPKYQSNYKDGLSEAWHNDRRPKYRGKYKTGKLISEKYFLD